MPATTRVDDDKRERIRTYSQKHPEVSARKIAEMMGLHHKTVSRILKGDIPLPAIDTLTEPPFEDELSGKWIYGKGYTYNGDSDTYVTILKCRPHPLVMSGTKFRAMKRAYSNWTEQDATVNQICRRFEIPRDQFIELKTIHGWTHDQEPFTKEEVVEKDTQELVDDVFQLKRQALWEGFEQKKWDATRKSADKWDNFEASFISPLLEHMGQFLPKYTPPLVNIQRARNPFAVVANTGELHYGKAGWVGETGQEYNREIAEQRLIEARAKMLQEVADRGRPEKFFWAYGNDYFHIDNERNSTTALTPQDCDGTAARIFSEGLEILFKDADSLLQVAPLEIVYVPGNHDHLLTFAALMVLREKYKDNKRVIVKLTAESRDYAVYGNTILGFGHGNDALKPKDFMATMAKDAREWWGATKHRAFFTGHFHSEVVRELVGGTHYQMKSLSGLDRYHEKNGYLSEAGMNSYVIDKERGVSSTILWSVN
jgi:hypothetical protein